MKHSFSLLRLLALAGALSISTAFDAAANSEIVSDNVGASVANTQQIAQATGDIVDVASSSPNFSTLVQAVQAAELVDLLKGSDPHTVFAPTNAAFEELPSGVLDDLLLPENQDLLTDVLAYHVVPGEVMSSDLETGLVDTLNGGLAVDVSPERVVVNDASVTQPDIPASNGVIHAISRVLVPVGLVEELQARTGNVYGGDDAETVEAETVEPEETTPPQEPVRGLW
ncbi:MAG: fasciclin domain-containing protein [Cyanobacteria bacterium J06636_28]